jgi:hypothetical protein
MSIKIRELKFVHIDFWSRAVFKDNYGNYFGNVDVLFDGTDDLSKVIERVNEQNMQYFGREIDGDPMGTKIKPDKIKIVKQFTEDESSTT